MDSDCELESFQKMLWKGLCPLQILTMVMKFEIFNKKKNIKFEKSRNSSFGAENQFAERFRRQNSSGSCAARSNITCSAGNIVSFEFLCLNILVCRYRNVLW